MKLTIGLLFAVALVTMSITIEASPSGGPLTSITKSTKTLTKEDGEIPDLEVCGECIQEVKGTIDQCKDTNDLFDCAKEVLGATSKCLECIGSIIDLVGGGDSQDIQTLTTITGTRILTKRDSKSLDVGWHILKTIGRWEEEWNHTRLRLLIECSECILDGIDFNDIFEECKDKDDIWASFECAKEAMKKSGVVGSCGECAANVIDDAIEALDEVDKSEEN